MIERLSTIEFESRVDPEIAMAMVRECGAVAIHNFVPVDMLHEAATELRIDSMKLDEDLRSSVRRRQEMSVYALRADPLAPPLDPTEKDAPPAMAALAAEVTRYVRQDEQTDWRPNEVIGHRYSSNHFIERHRDYTTAHGLVAVLTLDGLQDFYVELDGQKRAEKVTMRPGTLTMIRGYINNDPESRPYHWVGRPASGRLALSIREMHEHWDRPNPNIW
jgi:alkylated DNA repair dioxygenase AlkB